MSLFKNVGKSLFFSVIKSGLNKKGITAENKIECNYFVNTINEIVIDDKKITDGVTPELCLMLADKLKGQIKDYSLLNGCFFKIDFINKTASIKIYYQSINNEKKVYTYEQ